MAIYKLPKIYSPGFKNPRISPPSNQLDLSHSLGKHLYAYYDGSMRGRGIGANEVLFTNLAFNAISPSPNGLGLSLFSQGTAASSLISAGLHPEISGSQPFTFMYMFTVTDITGINLSEWRFAGTDITSGYFFRILDSGNTLEWIMNGLGVSDRVSISLDSTLADGDVLWCIGSYSPVDKLKIWVRQNFGQVITNESASVPTGTYSDATLTLMDDEGTTYTQNARIFTKAFSDSDARSILDYPYQVLKPANDLNYFVITALGLGPTVTTPTSGINGINIQSTGTDCDTITASSLKTTIGGASIALNITAQTTTTIDEDFEAGVNDATLGVPANGVPLFAQSLAAGATAWQLQHEVTDGANPNSINFQLNPPATHQTVQAMIATTNQNPGEGLGDPAISTTEDDEVWYGPKVVGSTNITIEDDLTITADSDDPITVDFVKWSPSTKEWSLVQYNIGIETIIKDLNLHWSILVSIPVNVVLQWRLLTTTQKDLVLQWAINGAPLSTFPDIFGDITVERKQ